MSALSFCLSLGWQAAARPRSICLSDFLTIILCGGTAAAYGFLLKKTIHNFVKLRRQAKAENGREEDETVDC